MRSAKYRMLSLFHRLLLRVVPHHRLSLIYRAEKALESGSWGRAFDLSQRAITQDRRCSWAYFIRALSRLKLDDHRGALCDIGTFLQLEEEPPPLVYYWRGWLYAQRAEWALALSDFDRALPPLAQSPDLHYWRGYAQWQRSDWQAMEQSLHALDVLQPGHPLVAELWGHFHLHHNALDAAEAAYTHALDSDFATATLRYQRALTRRHLGRLGDAREDLLTLLEDEPENGWGYLELSHLSYLSDQFDEALDYARHASTLLGPDVLEPKVQVAVALIELARHDQARDQLDAMATDHPGAAIIPFLQGDLLYADDAPDAAVVAYRRALALDPSLGPARHHLAEALMAAERYDEVEPLLNDLVAESPTSYAIRALRADLYRFTNRPEAMASDLERLLADHPDDAWALAYRASYRQWHGDVAGAEADYKRALDSDSSQGWIWAFRGDFYLLQGQLYLAHADFHRAITLEPENGWIRRQWAHLLWELNESARALVVLTSLVQEDPHDGYARLALAERYLQLDQADAAIEQLRRIVIQKHDLAWMAHAALAALTPNGEERRHHCASAEALRPASSFWLVSPARVYAQQALLAYLQDDVQAAVHHLGAALTACKPGESLWPALPPLLSRLGASFLLEGVLV